MRIERECLFAAAIDISERAQSSHAELALELRTRLDRHVVRGNQRDFI